MSADENGIAPTGGMGRARRREVSPARFPRARTTAPVPVPSFSSPPTDGGRADGPLAAEERAVCDAIGGALLHRAWNDPPLPAAVRAYARRSRELGVEPGPLVVAVKRLVRDRALPEASEWLRDVVTSRAVLWAIEAYFEETMR